MILNGAARMMAALFCGVSTICSYESIYDNKYCWMNIFTTGIDSKSLKETVFRGMMNKGYHHMV